MQASKSMPKSMKAHSIPSFLYSSCSSTNMWWLKNCWSFSFVKLIHSCSKLLNYNISLCYISTAPVRIGDCNITPTAKCLSGCESYKESRVNIFYVSVVCLFFFFYIYEYEVTGLVH
jgi:hypothetical protein